MSLRTPAPAVEANRPLSDALLAEIERIAARTPDSKILFTLRKARRSILIHPEPIVSRQTLINRVDNVGPRIADILAPHLPASRTADDPPQLQLETTVPDTPPPPAKRARKLSSHRRTPAPPPPSLTGHNSLIPATPYYMPAIGSRPYALLLALLRSDSPVCTVAECVADANRYAYSFSYTMNLAENTRTRTPATPVSEPWRAAISELSVNALVASEGTHLRLTARGRVLAGNIDSAILRAAPVATASPQALTLPLPLQSNLPRSANNTPIRAYALQNTVEAAAAPAPPSFSPLPPASAMRSLRDGEYEIVLLLDNREHINGDRSFFQEGLAERGVTFETRALPVGDALWVARARATGLEVVLDAVIERKRVDDLAASIRDNRWREQLWRLERCGLPMYFYVVEQSRHMYSLDPSAVLSAKIQSMLQGAHVVHTKSPEETLDFLTLSTRNLQNLWRGANVLYVADEYPVRRRSWLDWKRTSLRQRLAVADSPLNPTSTPPELQLTESGMRVISSLHITMQSFSKVAAKTQRTALRDLLPQMLMSVSGVSVEKALYLSQKKFSTPRDLMEALYNSAASSGDAADALCSFYNQQENMQDSLSIGRKKMGNALCRRVADVFSADSYDDAQRPS